MVALDAVRLLLADEQPALRDQLGVGRPAVGAVEADTPALQSLEQPLASGLVTTAQLPVDESSRSTIPSLPDPELVGLFFRKCHISSSSTTTARPSGSGFWAYTSAKRSIQACTLGVDTPSSLAVRFIDSPLRYSSTAVTLTRSGIPRGGVSVKFSPQALQRYRCRPFMKPFLTCSSPPHRLHRSPIVPLRRSFHRRRIWAIYAPLKPCLFDSPEVWIAPFPLPLCRRRPEHEIDDEGHAGARRMSRGQRGRGRP